MFFAKYRSDLAFEGFGGKSISFLRPRVLSLFRLALRDDEVLEKKFRTLVLGKYDVMQHVAMYVGTCCLREFEIYRVSHMDGIDFKELLWHHFWHLTVFSIIFMREKCVHFDI